MQSLFPTLLLPSMQSDPMILADPSPALTVNLLKDKNCENNILD